MLNELAELIQHNQTWVSKNDYQQLLQLTIYAGAKSSHVRLGANDARIGAMVALTNSAYRACGSLKAAMDYDYNRPDR
jgi:hypothetical protein